MCHEQSALHVVIKRNVFLHLFSSRLWLAIVHNMDGSILFPVQKSHIGSKLLGIRTLEQAQANFIQHLHTNHV